MYPSPEYRLPTHYLIISLISVIALVLSLLEIAILSVSQTIIEHEIFHFKQNMIGEEVMNLVAYSVCITLWQHIEV